MFYKSTITMCALNRFVFFICCCIIGTQTNAQSLDSLINNYKQIPEADIKKRADALLEIINTQIRSNHDSLIWRIDLAAKLYKQLGDESKYQEVNLEKRGLAANIKGHSSEALKLYLKYADYLRSIEKENENAYFYIDIGNIYYNFTLYQSAIKYYQKSERIFKSQQNNDGLSTIYGNYAMIAQSQKQVDTAIYYAELAFDIRTQTSKDAWDIAYQNQVLAASYELAQQWDSAKKCYQTALSLMKKPEELSPEKFGSMIVFLPNAAIQLGYCYLEEQKIDSALYALEQAKMFIEKHQIIGVFNNKLVVFELKLLAAQRKYQEALALGHSTLDKVSTYSVGEMGFKLKATFYKEMEQIAQKMNDTKKQYEYHYWAHIYQDSLDKGQTNDQMLAINGLVLEMENEQIIQNQKLEIAEQEKIVSQERQTRQILTFIVAGTLFFLLLMAILWWLVRRKNLIIRAYSAQLEQSNNTKEMLISVVSHDLRSPFNTLLQITQKTANAQLSELEQRMQTANNTARQTFWMLDNLLRWVGLQKDSMAVHPQPVNLHDTLEGALNMISTEIQNKNIQIIKSLSNTQVHVDKDMLVVILRNILQNAVRHSPAHCQISITNEIKNGYCLLRISDQGGGISKNVLEMIKSGNFNTGNVAQKGGGMGLFLVVKFAKKMGLQYQAYNNEQGAVFQFHLPLAPNQTTANTLPENQNIIDNNAPQYPVLSAQDTILLRPFMEELKKMELYESTDIILVLERIPDANPAIKQWKNEVYQAVKNADQIHFEKLLDY